MKKTMLALAFVALAAPALAQTSDTRPTIAVLPFGNGAIEPTWGPLSKGFQDLVLTQLARNTSIRVVERENITKILDEQKLGQSGQLDPATVIRVGKILGARYMITGGYMSQDKDLILTIRAFDTETSEMVYVDGPMTGPSARMMDLVVRAAQNANANLKLPQLPANSAPAREAAAATEKSKKVPFQALMLYSKAVEAEDKGQRAQALTLYRQAHAQFPDFDKAKQAADKLSKSE
jgi:TolB-like protein